MADIEHGILHRNFRRQYLPRGFRREIEIRHHNDKAQEDAGQKGKALHMPIRHRIHRKSAIDRGCDIVGMSLDIGCKLQEIIAAERTVNQCICRREPRDNRRRTAPKPP